MRMPCAHAGLETGIQAGGQSPPPPVAPDGRAGANHLVQFYENDEYLVEVVGEFLRAGLVAGEPLVVIATEAHRTAFAGALKAKGCDVARAAASGQLRLFDARETLSKFMVGSMPDEERFKATIGNALEAAISVNAGARLRAYGEIVDLLWRDGNHNAAIRLEELWNDLQKTCSFSLLCAYVMAGFYKEAGDLQHVCVTHTHVLWPERGDSRLDEADIQTPAVPLQYARSLAAEISQRQRVEQALRDALRDLRAKEEELRRSEHALRDFVENAALGLHWVGPDGRILWANRAELKLLGYEKDEYIGRSIADFHVDPPVIANILTCLRNKEDVHDCEARLRAKDGSVRHVLITSNVLWQGDEFIHTRCFTRDITERKRLEEALRQNQAQLQTIADALPMLVAYLDAEQRYRFVNASYERWFGRSSADLVGKHIRDVLGNEVYAGIRPRVEAALAGEHVEFEARIPYGHGGERFIEATYIPDLGPGGQVRGCIGLVADVSERKRLEEQRDASALRSERLGKITAAIADAITREEVVEAVVDQVSSALGTSSASLWVLEPDGRTCRLLRAIGYAESSKRSIEAFSLDEAGRLPAADCIRNAQPLWIESQAELLERYPHLSSVVTQGRAYRIVCIPIAVQGRTIGALGFTFDGAPELGDDQRSFVSLVARHTGQALERLRLLDAERESRHRAEAAAARMGLLSRASRAFSEAAVDTGALLQAVAEHSTLEFADVSGVTLLLEGSDVLEVAAVHHRDPAVTESLRALMRAAPVRVGEGILGRVVQTGESIFLPDGDLRVLLPMVRPEHRVWIEHIKPSSLLVVPLRVRGKVIGTLGAMRQEPKERFNEEDKRLLEEIAERAALAIHAGRLQSDNRQGRVRAELLYGLASAVNGAERVEEVFDIALDGIERALGTTRSSILTFDPDGVMRFKSWRGLSESYCRAVEGHSPWPRDARAPEPILIPDVQADPGMSSYLPLFEREGIRALGFIPLVAAGRLHGKFMVYYDRPRALTVQEREMAKAIANHVAAAVARFEAMAGLKETVRYNELFAGVLAHDLRNPLGAILTSARLVLQRQEGEGDKVRKPLSRIISSGERMTRMVDQLLDFTRARVGGGFELQPRETNLALICRQVVDELIVANPEWTMTVQEAGNLEGTWDSDRLSQVISNLAANAGQHGNTEAGVRLRLDGMDADVVRLEVQNQGTIPESVRASLFDPFRRAGQRREHARGLGLGLFITKELVVAHGGNVEVSSSDANSTIFTVTLPRDSARRAHSTAAPTRAG